MTINYTCYSFTKRHFTSPDTPREDMKNKSIANVNRALPTYFYKLKWVSHALNVLHRNRAWQISLPGFTQKMSTMRSCWQTQPSLSNLQLDRLTFCQVKLLFTFQSKYKCNAWQSCHVWHIGVCLRGHWEIGHQPLTCSLCCAHELPPRESCSKPHSWGFQWKLSYLSIY